MRRLDFGEEGLLQARTWNDRVNRVSSNSLSHSRLVVQQGHRMLNDPNSEPYEFFSPHTGAGVFAFADGSVHALSLNTDVTVLQALATRGGGEVVGDF